MAEVRESMQEKQAEGQGQSQSGEQQLKVQGAAGESPRNVETPNRMLTPFEEMDRIMDRIFEGMAPRGLFRSLAFDRPFFSDLARQFSLDLVRAPSVDVVNREEEILVRAEVPGVEKDKLQVSVTDNVLTIRGECSHEDKTEDGDYYRKEISRGMFSRSMTLPSDVDGSQAKATFRNGVLELKLPKITKSRRHTIDIE